MAARRPATFTDRVEVAWAFFRVVAARVAGTTPYPEAQRDEVWRQVGFHLRHLSATEVDGWWKEHGHKLCRALGRPDQGPPNPQAESGDS